MLNWDVYAVLIQSIGMVFFTEAEVQVHTTQLNWCTLCWCGVQLPLTFRRNFSPEFGYLCPYCLATFGPLRQERGLKGAATPFRGLENITKKYNIG